MRKPDLDYIVTRLAEKLRPALLDSNPMLTKRQAADFLQMSETTFDRERERFPEALKPAREIKPLLWTKDRLEIYRATCWTGRVEAKTTK